MKYQVGDIVRWKMVPFDPKESTMIIIEVIPFDSFRSSSKQQYYYRYRYLETQREDSYMGTLYEYDTIQMA
jgi:hypothetical protein